MAVRDGATRLGDLTWRAAAAWFRRDPRLLLPVGSMVQHGPHLPLDADSRITSAIAAGIAGRHGVLLGPTLPFGVAAETDRSYAGTSAIAHKTLHRLLNDLAADWERQGLEELVLLTSNGFGPHYRALVGVMAGRIELRAVDTNVVDLSPALNSPTAPERGGEVETSLLLYLAPETVHMERAEDLEMERGELDQRLDGTEPVPLPGSNGVLGRPSCATAEKGRRIYDYLVRYIGDRLFGSAEA